MENNNTNPNIDGQTSNGTPAKIDNDKLRLLISDDSRLLRKKLREELEKLNCEVVEAANGKEAIMRDLEDEPDGVILDIVMPEVGGIEALQVIREVSPDVPIVMLSSAGTPQKLMQTLKMGAIDFIQKPYTKEQIVKAVEAIRRAKVKRQKKKMLEEAQQNSAENINSDKIEESV
ncbi:MAG: response regulator [Selenomonadaceae bacterium]|nr:response regulator [Selenomonadaceae bacterium]